MVHFLQARERVLLCGHRGHSVDGHENSAEALDLAARYGADICEIDLRLSADKVMVVFHDQFLDETSTGTGGVSEHGWSELQDLHHVLRGTETQGARLSRLEDILDHALRIGMNLVIELKDSFDDPALMALLSLIRDRQALDRVLISSFDHVMLKRLNDLDPEMLTFGIVHARLCDAVAVARAGGFQVISLDYPAAALADAGALRQAGLTATHLVRGRDHYLRAGARGVAELEMVVQAVRAGDIGILFCDDVAWGSKVRDAVNVRDLLAD
ncbi:glycerophosphodiester phosphodiesterase family protein [Paracoccus sp. SCSIO 75233]|uniref:glycerophosphodiester phosphodiesterase n=1 Tax=Paracoccus sp. SCSIO 75233 TaxID=3017782 RepID=UPI0022F13667|nr:glycerophosphodiester phosphodiesterase family protein [Paracoccus sp. SCSIO 75233]WBU53748.1 glycerophosphodiester phosphodiesterase family protein [Paracoccus sp. SCSIO 75233]